jgi:hypothetical protein
MKESQFQSKLKKKLKERFEGCIVLKNDCNIVQGIPDLLVLYGDKWAALENKRSASASKRPNQEYWVDKMNEMSYAKFVSPENEEEVLDDLEKLFKA